MYQNYIPTREVQYCILNLLILNSFLWHFVLELSPIGIETLFSVDDGRWIGPHRYCKASWGSGKRSGRWRLGIMDVCVWYIIIAPLLLSAAAIFIILFECIWSLKRLLLYWAISQLRSSWSPHCTIRSWAILHSLDPDCFTFPSFSLSIRQTILFKMAVQGGSIRGVSLFDDAALLCLNMGGNNSVNTKIQ